MNNRKAAELVTTFSFHSGSHFGASTPSENAKARSRVHIRYSGASPPRKQRHRRSVDDISTRPEPRVSSGLQASIHGLIQASVNLPRKEYSRRDYSTITTTGLQRGPPISIRFDFGSLSLGGKNLVDDPRDLQSPISSMQNLTLNACCRYDGKVNISCRA